MPDLPIDDPAYWEAVLAAEGMPAELPSADGEINDARRKLKTDAARISGERRRRRGLAS